MNKFQIMVRYFSKSFVYKDAPLRGTFTFGKLTELLNILAIQINSVLLMACR